MSDTTRLSAEDAAKSLQSSFDGTPGGYGYQTINRAVLDAFDDGGGITNQAVKCTVEVANL